VTEDDIFFGVLDRLREHGLEAPPLAIARIIFDAGKRSAILSLATRDILYDRELRSELTERNGGQNRVHPEIKPCGCPPPV